MYRSKHELLKSFQSIAVAGVMAFTLVMAPAAAMAARGGGGGGMRGGGFGGGARAGGFGGGGGGVRAAPSMPRGGGFSAPRAPSYSMPRAPSYSAPRYSAPSYSAPRYSSPSYSAPRAAPSYSAPRAPSYSTPRAPSYATPAAPSYSTPRAAPGYTTPRVPSTMQPRVTQPTRVAPTTPAQPGAGPGQMRQPGAVQPGTQPSRARQGASGAQPGAPVYRTPNTVTTPGAVGQPQTPAAVPGRVPTGINGRTRPGTAGQPGTVGRPGRGPGQPGAATQPGTVGRPGRVPGQPGAATQPGTVGRPGRVPGQPGVTRPGRGPGNLGSQARRQWDQNRNQHRGNWNRHGNWNNNYWNWNSSSFWLGFFFYPAFAAAFNYGYWGFDDCGAYCTYSPFYYYGFPYVYAPRVDVVQVPTYTYTQVPAYSGGYYLDQGQYSGLNQALDDIRNAWINGRADLMASHIDPNAQIAIYLDNNYAYSLAGSDYGNMVRDAIGKVRTVSMTFDNVEQRSDGAYTAYGTHQFYDINGNLKTVNISFTLAQQGGQWVIVSAGSSE